MKLSEGPAMIAWCGGEQTNSGTERSSARCPGALAGEILIPGRQLRDTPGPTSQLGCTMLKWRRRSVLTSTKETQEASVYDLSVHHYYESQTRCGPNCEMTNLASTSARVRMHAHPSSAATAAADGSDAVLKTRCAQEAVLLCLSSVETKYLLASSDRANQNPPALERFAMTTMSCSNCHFIPPSAHHIIPYSILHSGIDITATCTHAHQ